MTVPQLKPAIDAAGAALASWNSFVEALTSLEGSSKETFDLELGIPNLSPPTTIRQIETKLSGAISLAHSLSDIGSVELIPDGTVNELTTRISSVQAIVDRLLAHQIHWRKKVRSCHSIKSR